LLRYGRQTAANALLNGYLRRTSLEHLQALAALAPFLSLRAAIRAKVRLARLDRTDPDGADLRDAARCYFELAQRLIHPPAPRLVAIGGLSGTGKSSVARALAPFVLPQPGAVVLRSDVLRKQIFQVDEMKPLPASAYRPEITAQVYEALLCSAVDVLSQGHSVVVDAVFAAESERAAIHDAARRLNIRFAGFFLVAELATRLERIGQRQRDASDATPEVASAQEKYDIGEFDWAKIDASGTPEQTLKRCRAGLG
jgi:hypothetical protein